MIKKLKDKSKKLSVWVKMFDNKISRHEGIIIRKALKFYGGWAILQFLNFCFS